MVPAGLTLVSPASGKWDVPLGSDDQVSLANFVLKTSSGGGGGGGNGSGGGGGGGGDVAGPRVLSFRPLVAGKKKPATYVLTFDEVLNSALAGRTSEYVFVDAGKDRKYGTRDDRKISIKKAVYNAAARTVTLTPGKALAAKTKYRFTVMGTSAGLKNTQGNLLDGRGNGQPGSDYVAFIKGGHVTPS